MVRHSILATLVAVCAAWSNQKFHSKRDISQLSRKLNNNNNINRNSSIVFILKLVSYMLVLLCVLAVLYGTVIADAHTRRYTNICTWPKPFEVNRIIHGILASIRVDG